MKYAFSYVHRAFATIGCRTSGSRAIFRYSETSPGPRLSADQRASTESYSYCFNRIKVAIIVQSAKSNTNSPYIICCLPEIEYSSFIRFLFIFAKRGTAWKRRILALRK